VVNYKEDYAIPFEARYGQGHRFTHLRKEPVADLSGEWAVQFGIGEEAPYPGIAEFKQEGNHLLGTFRTETGDYRFLEGTVQTNKLYLSCFDGSHAFLFEGKIMEDGSLQGLFRSGSHYLTYWEARRDPTFRLASPDSLTVSTLGDQPLTFEFTDTEGRKVSSRDEAFAGRPLVLSIMGTWCPNCLDESLFLKTYLEEHPDLDLAVVGIGFERYREEEKALAALRRYREKLALPYPLLYGGYYSKKEAASHVPFLSDIIAYPTMIFTDRDHRIVRIHTGFDGPATSKYQDFRTEFHNFVQLLAGPSQ
jgi:thiol-disulfide isomerase/thioredoxin